jgi:hypothetical protein
MNNYNTRDPRHVTRDPVPRNAGLSREFVVESILHILDTAAAAKGWGSVTVQFQAGVFKTIREEKTITEEE